MKCKKRGNIKKGVKRERDKRNTCDEMMRRERERKKERKKERYINVF